MRVIPAVVVALAATLVAAPSFANAPPNAILIDGSEVAENLPPGAPIGVLTAIDPDVDDAHTFLLVDNPTNAFRVEPDGRTLATARVLDYEARSNYAIRVRATDPAGAFFEQSFIVTVVNANDPPLGVALNPSGIAEDRPLFSVVGQLIALGDQDQADLHSFELLDDADGTFVVEGDRLVTRVPLDFETRASYSVLVEVSDLAGAAADGWVTVTIYDRNEPPLDVTLSGPPVAENAPPGTTVGALAALGDPDAGDAHSFQIVSALPVPFTIIGATLRTTTPLDFEATPTWTLTIRATDLGGLWVERPVLVALGDVNEAPTGVALDADPIAEDAAPGSVVGALVGVDPDANDAHTFAPLGPVDAPFSLVGGILVTTGPLDHEARSSYLLGVRVTDAAGLAVDATLVVEVADVNEAPTAVALTPAHVFEDANEYAAVGLLDAGDPDADDAHTFTIVDDPDGKFLITDRTLRLSRRVDFETKASHTVRIRATDLGGLAVEADLLVAVRDVNEAPSGVAISASEVAEGLAAGTLVGELSAGGDPDVGDAHTFALVQNPGGAFRIDGARLETTRPLDFEATERYFLRIRATDSGGLWAEASVEVAVLDVNEAPTGVTLSGASVGENRPADQWIGQLQTTGDPDRNEVHTYAIVDNPDDAFAIGAGALKTARRLDFETRSSYDLVIRSTDKGGLSVDVPFTVSVLDENEPPTGVALDATHVHEELPIGSTVGVFTALGDPDLDEVHTFSLQDSAGGRFGVSGATLVTQAVFDYEDDDRAYRIQVEVRDSGGRTASASFNIIIDDVNEPPSNLTLVPAEVDENLGANTVVGQLTAIGDPDAGEVHTFALPDDSTGAFDIAGDTLVTRRPLDHETEPTIAIRVEVTDTGGHVLGRDLVVTVVDVNEPPLAVALDVAEIAENELAGATIGQLSVVGDPDAGDRHELEIVDDPDGVFALEGQLLVTTRPLDHEAAAEHRVAIMATDVAGLSVTTELVVAVLDVNDPPALSPAGVILTPVDEDEYEHPGDGVAWILERLEVTDDDPGPAVGVLVRDVDEAHGRWEFRTKSVDWTPFDGGWRVLSDHPANRVRFVPDPDWNGRLEPALVLQAWDGTRGADGGAVTPEEVEASTAFSADSATASLDVIAHNDPPVVSAPGAELAALERVPLRIAAAGPLAVADVDATELDVELRAPRGELRLAPTAGVTVVGGGQGSSTLTVSGTIEALNEALASLTFTGGYGVTGAAELVITALDRGATGAGGPRFGVATVALDVRPAPDIEVAREGVVLQSGDVDELGALGAGGAVDLVYRVRNRGSLPLTLSGVSPVVVSSRDNAEAFVTVEPARTLGAAQDALLVVRARPVVPGEFEAAFTVATNDPDEDPFTWTVRGASYPAPRLELRHDGAAVEDAVYVDVGGLLVGAHTPLVFRIKNTGATLLHLGASQLSDLEGCEIAVEHPFPELDPGATELLRIHVMPLAEGPFEGRVSFESDDPAGLRTLWLRGRGVVAGAGAFEVSRIAGVPLFEGDEDDVGAVLYLGEAGAETSYRWTVRNTGLRTLNLGPLEVTAASGVGAEATLFDARLAPGEATTALVTVRPEVSGPFDVDLRLGVDAAVGGSFSWSVVGESIGELEARPRLWREGEGLLGDEDGIGAVAVGASRRLVYRLDNGGTRAFSVASPVYLRDLVNAEGRVVHQPASVIGPSGDATAVVVELGAVAPGPLRATLVVRGAEVDAGVERALTITSPGQAAAVSLRLDGRELSDGDSVTIPLRAAGEVVRLTGSLVNDGSAPLALTGEPRLVGDAACREVTLAVEGALAPGGSAPLVVDLEMPTGLFTCRLELATNAPERDGRFEITLRGLGQPPPEGGGCASAPASAPAALALLLVVWLATRRRRPHVA